MRCEKFMNEEIGIIVFDYFTEPYKAKLNLNKDLDEYLKEITKEELVDLYVRYSIVTKNDSKLYGSSLLRNKKKAEVAENAIPYIKDNILKVIKELPQEYISKMEYMSNRDGFLTFEPGAPSMFSLQTVLVLERLKLIFCKKERNRLLIHVPDTVKSLVRANARKIKSKYNVEVTKYTEGLVTAYGALFIEDAYNILKKDIKITLDDYVKQLDIVCMLSLAPISRENYDVITALDISDEDALQLLDNDDIKYVTYDKEMYMNLANDKYILGLKEYKVFNNYMINVYTCDLNAHENEDILHALVFEYIYMNQISESQAKSRAEEIIDEFFEADKQDKHIICDLIQKIAERMPNWKAYGNIIDNKKIGTNELCSCGSGKKHKQCCGKKQ